MLLVKKNYIFEEVGNFIWMFNMKSNNVKDVVLLIFKVDFGLRNEKNIFNIFEKG